MGWQGMEEYWADVRPLFTDPFADLVDASFARFHDETLERSVVGALYRPAEEK